MRSSFQTALLAFACISWHAQALADDSPRKFVPEDLYRLEGPQSVVMAPSNDGAAVVRRWIDQETKRERLALWWKDSTSYRALESDEPDARSVTFSPDGKWLAIRSTRPRPNGWKQTPSVPLQSDPATDIWLVSADGSRSVPLAESDRPYGRVFNDPFYGSVSFSPDGKRLAFVADDGADPRTRDEMEAGVDVVRPDQGEGYTGYGTAQSWTQHELSGMPWEVADRMRAMSPFARAGQIRTPTLILHSRDDRRCPLPMGKMFHQALLARGVPTQMVIYPNEGHAIRQPQHQVDVLRRTLAWFSKHDANAPLKIVMLGDSITKGVRSGVTTEQTFSSRVQAALREHALAAEVMNVGIGGERTDQALQRLQRDVIAHTPRIVVIMYGTNDSYVDQGHQESRLSEQEYRDNLVQLVERLRRAGIQPLLMTEPRWSATARPNGIGEHPNQRLEKYSERCREVAKELNVPMVDHFAHWSTKEKEGQDLNTWTTDTCHPNPAGHEVLTRLMVPAIEGLVSESSFPRKQTKPMGTP